MKCPHCGADLTGGKFCEYCGSQISVEMKKEQEKINKAGCPRCQSSNVSFHREKRGEIRDDDLTAIVHSTVGVCGDCGYTWETAEFSGNSDSPRTYNSSRATEAVAEKPRRTWLWVLGWIFMFPIPLTVIMLRKKNLNPIVRFGVIALAWAFYFGIALTGDPAEDYTDDSGSDTYITESYDVSIESAEKVS